MSELKPRTEYQVFGTKRVKAGYDIERQRERFAFLDNRLSDELLKIYQLKVLTNQAPVFLCATGGRNMGMIFRLINELEIPKKAVKILEVSKINRETGNEYIVLGLEAKFTGEMKMPVPYEQR